MNEQIIPIFMFVLLTVTVVLGIPIAFATGIVALVFAYILWGSSSVFALLTATAGVMNNWTLLAVPLFTLMSMVLYKCGIVEDLYDTFYKWTGFLRGGLAVASIVVGALMGAMTGVVAGSVVALGKIALPQMLKYKYNKEISMGAILSGGTLGQLIPPSTLMIIYGSITGVSVGGLFAGGIACGFILAAIYSSYVLIKSYLQKDLCPGLPPEETVTWKEKFESLKGVLLPLFVIISVLGSIFSGIATPTEAAAVGAVGAILCALVKKSLKLKPIREAFLETLRITAMVGWITIGALYFGQVFTALGGDKFIMKLTTIIPLGNWGIMAVFMVLLYLLGMFLDTVAIVVICAPLFAPIAIKLGFDPLWFGLIFMVNLQAAYLTPPFGYSLFYLKGVTPENISLGDIYRSAIPFVALQIMGLALFILFPKLVLFLPNILFAR